MHRADSDWVSRRVAPPLRSGREREPVANHLALAADRSAHWLCSHYHSADRERTLPARDRAVVGPCHAAIEQTLTHHLKRANSVTTIALVTHLLELSDDDLVTLIEKRGVRPNSINDFFDLAETLVSAESLRSVLKTQTRTTLIVWVVLVHAAKPLTRQALTQRVRALPAGASADESDVDRSVSALVSVAVIAHSDDGYIAYQPGDSVDAILDHPSLTDDDPPTLIEALTVADAETRRHQCAERAAHSANAVATLLTDLRTVAAKNLQKGGLALPAAKRLADILGMDPSRVHTVLSLAADAGLVSLTAGYWTPSEAATSWLGGNFSERWQLLALSWLNAIDPEVRLVLTTNEITVWGESLLERVEWLYPLSAETMRKRMEATAEKAEWLGITLRGIASDAGVALLQGEPSVAAERIVSALPPSVTRVYLQDDLTVVSPGPLHPEIAARLRTMAILENRSLASTYRFTPASLDNALESGETEQSIRAFLTEISLTPLPQSVEYLIGDTARRHGLIRVREAQQGTDIVSSDPGVLREVEVDRRLRFLRPSRVSDTVVTSLAPFESVYWALREAHYPAVAERNDGTLVHVNRPQTPHTHVSPSRANAGEDTRHAIRTLVSRLRAQEARETPIGGDMAARQRWLTRELEHAVRTRQQLTVTVQLPSGETHDFLLEPTGLAGGRFRGRDATADIERTLPVSHIVAVRSGEEKGSVD